MKPCLLVTASRENSGSDLAHSFLTFVMIRNRFILVAKEKSENCKIWENYNGFFQ